MNWNRLKRSIPDRVLIGVGGIVGAILFACGPTLLAEWVRFWLS